MRSQFMLGWAESRRAVHESSDRFTIETGRHRIAVDTRVADGVAYSAPPHLWRSSWRAWLGAWRSLPSDTCVGTIRSGALELEATFTMSEGDRRVSAIHVRIQPPEGFPPHRRRGMLAAVRRCPVHNSIVEIPLIDVELDVDAVAA